MSTVSSSREKNTETPPATTTHDELPFARRKAEDTPGHWLLARLGKKVLRPGGRHLTEKMVGALPLAGSDVVELAPGLGLTARLLLDGDPGTYTGVEEDPAAAAISAHAIGERGTVVTGNAKKTGLPDACCDVVVNEAMLTMNTDTSKGRILDEVARILRPGGHYAIHELSLTPDDISDDIAAEVRTALARSIKVNARPLTTSEWVALLAEHGLQAETVSHAEMALLHVRRVISDEGFVGTLRIGRNYLRDPDARRRVNIMWRCFHRYRRSIAAVSIIARKAPVGDA